MTKQELFDKVATHLMTQRQWSKTATSCRYRTDEGLACAIGCLIPEDQYTFEFEGFAIYSPLYDSTAISPSFYRQKLLQATGLSRDLLPLAGALQTIHDDFGPRMWSLKLAHLAGCEGLNPAILETFDPIV